MQLHQAPPAQSMNVSWFGGQQLTGASTRLPPHSWELQSGAQWTTLKWHHNNNPGLDGAPYSVAAGTFGSINTSASGNISIRNHLMCTGFELHGYLIEA